jgi:hypothetical protein
MRQLLAAGTAITLASPAVRQQDNITVVPLREVRHRTCYVAWRTDRIPQQWADHLHNTVLTWYLNWAQQCDRYWTWLSNPSNAATTLLEPHYLRSNRE